MDSYTIEQSEECSLESPISGWRSSLRQKAPKAKASFLKRRQEQKLKPCSQINVRTRLFFSRGRQVRSQSPLSHYQSQQIIPKLAKLQAFRPVLNLSLPRRLRASSMDSAAKPQGYHFGEFPVRRIYQNLRPKEEEPMTELGLSAREVQAMQALRLMGALRTGLGLGVRKSQGRKRGVLSLSRR